ncbi:glycosyltransferase family A protein [uncultured Bilophila sp.]|uniref:glycosyltransferase family 2 protein n=1 Tax=uncultured Bilophila sp. TaxID=529385 RepID=UPI00280AE220|nr:glycosyltransferase family A protein [uncultured Bilophila sp.]
MVKVSVIIPVYNVAPYLGECLDSVLAQSLRDIEIICVDDCSTDDSLRLLRKYAEGDSRVRVLSNDKNRDVSETRNRGIKESCGEYIFLWILMILFMVIMY